MKADMEVVKEPDVTITMTRSQAQSLIDVMNWGGHIADSMTKELPYVAQQLVTIHYEIYSALRDAGFTVRYK